MTLQRILEHAIAGAFAVGLAANASVAVAQVQTETQKYPLIELSAEATQSVANDLGRAQAYVELSEANPSELARHVNQKVGEVLNLAKGVPSVKVRSGGVQTYPVYSKTGSRIESWRMRSDILLESQDLPALSDLVGRLQSIAAISQLTLTPAPDTQQRALDSAMIAAIKAFRARAELAAQTLGKPWRIKNLNLSSASDHVPVMRAAMAKSFSAADTPAPIEAGESQIRMMASGSIELLDEAR
jgi:predicted secreted protein